MTWPHTKIYITRKFERCISKHVKIGCTSSVLTWYMLKHTGNDFLLFRMYQSNKRSSDYQYYRAISSQGNLMEAKWGLQLDLMLVMRWLGHSPSIHIEVDLQWAEMKDM